MPAEEGKPVRELELSGAGGLRLHARHWSPERPRATLLVAHGLGEHSGRFASPAAELVRRGIGVFALDFRGHGRSKGQRGHVRRFRDLVADLHALREEAARSAPGSLPTLLFGHSLGGLIAARYLETHPDAGLRAAVLSAPALGWGSSVPRWRRGLARVLSPLLPRLPARNGLDAEDLSHDADQVAAYRSDPRVHHWITPRLFTEMDGAMRLAAAERERIRVPLLVLVPGADRIVDADATLAFCRGMPFDVRRIADSFHEPLHEVQRRTVLAEMIDWMEARIG